MSRIRLSLCLCLVLTMATRLVVAQPQDWLISVKDAPLTEFIAQIAEITGNTIIIDPRVRQNDTVTVISNTRMDAEGVYELFLSVLRVHGYGIVQNEGIMTVVQNPVVKQAGGKIGDGEDVPNEEIITRVIEAQHVTAADLVKTLRPLIPQYGHIASIDGPNIVLLSDHANNIRRLIALIAEIDIADDEDVVVVNLKHIWVGNVLAMLQEVAPDQLGQSAQGPQSVQLIANEANNTLVIRGRPDPISEVIELVEKLDQPSTATGNVQVLRLNHADAVAVAEILNNLNQESSIEGAPPPPSIQAYESLNAIIIRGDPNSVTDLLGITERLDVRRLQVHIAAAIVEVSIDTNRAFGIEAAGVDNRTADKTSIPFVSTALDPLNPLIGPLLNQVANAPEGTNGTVAALGAATQPTLAVAKIEPDGISFGAIINALAVDANANLLSTPSLLTLDNQEARVLVGQEIPIRTGSFTTTTDGASNPFTTISRKEVGVELVVTPHIHEDSSIRLDVEQKVSNVSNVTAADASGLSDIVTNTRSIQTTILADDRQTIVLGGLMQDDERRTYRKVPLLGSIPILGYLFRSQGNNRIKRHLLVFLKPTIQRTAADVQATTEEVYQGIRKVRIEARGRKAKDAKEEETSDDLFEMK